MTTIDLIVSDDHQVLVYGDGKWVSLKQYHSTRQFIEQLCLRNGTTLEGCYEASRVLLNNAYKRPIYIGGGCNQIFVPTCSIKNRECNWISLNYLSNHSLQHYNHFGYDDMSEQRWQKHLYDGTILKTAIFGKETL